MPSKVRDEIGKYAHGYETQAAIAHFCGKYKQYTLKRTTVNNWKRKFSNPQKEVGEPPEKFNKKGRPSLVGEELTGKNKGSDYQNKTNRSCDFLENCNFNR